MAGKAFLFLNGFYHPTTIDLVRTHLKKHAPRPVIVGVDGGLAFLNEHGLKADIWITDFDSAPRQHNGFSPNAEVYVFPAHKDQTDSELAVDICLKKGLPDLTVFGWRDNGAELDHMLGNLMLIRKYTKRTQPPRIHFVEQDMEVFTVRNNSLRLNGYKDHGLSVLPVSNRIRVTLTGTAYRANDLSVREGETISLRNRITAQRAVVIVQGTALVIAAKPRV